MKLVFCCLCIWVEMTQKQPKQPRIPTATTTINDNENVKNQKKKTATISNTSPREWTASIRNYRIDEYCPISSQNKQMFLARRWFFLFFFCSLCVHLDDCFVWLFIPMKNFPMKNSANIKIMDFHFPGNYLHLHGLVFFRNVCILMSFCNL